MLSTLSRNGHPTVLIAGCVGVLHYGIMVRDRLSVSGQPIS